MYVGKQTREVDLVGNVGGERKVKITNAKMKLQDLKCVSSTRSSKQSSHCCVNFPDGSLLSLIETQMLTGKCTDLHTLEIGMRKQLE